jgi:site-specific recombinase XerD
VRDLRREHIEAWLIELLGRWKPATVNNRYRGLQAFFRWCIDEDIIATSPMAKMKPPKVPEQPVPVLRLDAVAKLIATAERTKTSRTSGTMRSSGSSTRPGPPGRALDFALPAR